MAASVQARAGPSSGAMYDIKCSSEDDHAAALAVTQLETCGKLQLHRLLQSISRIEKGRGRVKQFGDCHWRFYYPKRGHQNPTSSKCKEAKSCQKCGRGTPECRSADEDWSGGYFVVINQFNVRHVSGAGDDSAHDHLQQQVIRGGTNFYIDT